MVYIKGTYQVFNDGNSTRFRIQSVQQLASTGPSLAESVLLQVPVHQLDETKIAKLKTICENQKGKSKLKIVLVDRATQTSLQMVSDEYRIEVNAELLNEFRNLGLEYVLN